MYFLQIAVCENESVLLMQHLVQSNMFSAHHGDTLVCADSMLPADLASQLSCRSHKDIQLQTAAEHQSEHR